MGVNNSDSQLASARVNGLHLFGINVRPRVNN